MLQATVIIPTFDHGRLLAYAARGVLAQTVDEIELFIVGDGVPDVTREVVAELTRSDSRVRFFDNPKAPSRGETHRHAALREARGRIVCYLSDDDLWFPDHVATMQNLLADADFANTLPLRIDPTGGLGFYVVNLALPADRELLLSGTNRVPLSCGAHTLQAYRELPSGWRAAPRGKATDLHMWQQFLARSDCRAVSGTRPTALNFPDPPRAGWTTDERLGELDRWSRRIADTAWREGFVSEAFDALVLEYASEVARLRSDVANHQAWVRGLQQHIRELERPVHEPRQGLERRPAELSSGRRENRTRAVPSALSVHYWVPEDPGSGLNGARPRADPSAESIHDRLPPEPRAGPGNGQPKVVPGHRQDGDTGGRSGALPGDGPVDLG